MADQDASGVYSRNEIVCHFFEIERRRNKDEQLIKKRL